MKRIGLSTVAFSVLLSAGLVISGCQKSNSNNAQNQPAATSNAATTQANPPAPPSDQASSSSQPRLQQRREQQAQSRPAPAPQVVIPAGTDIEVRVDQDLGSKINHSGDTFTATVARAVTANGEVVIPRDSQAEGLVVDAKSLGRFAGHAVLSLRLERISVGNRSFPVMSSTISRVRKGKGKRTGVMAAGGGALGAIIGGIAGGGRGALIGAGAGAGAGTAGSAFTDNKNIVIPSETLLTFRTERPIRME